MFLKAVTLLAVAATSLATPVPSVQKDARSLSLFAVVTFPNDQCTSKDDETTLGTCLSATECDDRDGTNDGNCAAGFGICCTFRVTSGDVNDNCTYLENEGFPSAVVTATTTTSTYTIKRVNSDICQLRFDFVAGMLPITAVGGTNPGSCDGTVTITSPSGLDPPVLCGNLAGDHLFVDVDRSSTDATVAVATGASTTASRTWKIKVTQIECTNLNRAPKDCAQFYTGVSGIVQSFAFASSVIPVSLAYTVCFRQEMGFCGLQLSENSAIQAPMDPFFMRITAAIATSTDVDTLACASSRINFPFFPNTGSLCGGIFGTTEADTVPGIVQITEPPLMFNVITPATTVVTSTGFSLQYTQTPC